MVQVTADVMKEFKQAIKDMKEYSVTTGDPNSPDETSSKVGIEWTSSDVMDRPRLVFFIYILLWYSIVRTSTYEIYSYAFFYVGWSNSPRAQCRRSYLYASFCVTPSCALCFLKRRSCLDASFFVIRLLPPTTRLLGDFKEDFWGYYSSM